MKIFITGGTGFIGKHLVRRLSQTEHKLFCLARETSDITSLKEVGANIFIGDVTDRDSILKGMKECDWVVHLASSFVLWHSNKKIFPEVNITGTQNVMECVLQTGISKVVYVSTAAIYGNAEWPITEETPVGGKRMSKYVKTKYKGDLITWNLYEEKKLPLVVIYPSAVTGPDDPKATGRYIRNFAKGRMPAQVLTKCFFPFVHVKDVSEAILRALEKENNIGEKYILAAENITFGYLNQMISEISGTKLPFIKLPNWMTMLTAYLLTGIANLTRKHPLWDMSIDQIKLMKQGFQIDGSKVERELGITYTPIREAFKEAINS